MSYRVREQNTAQDSILIKEVYLYCSAIRCKVHLQFEHNNHTINHSFDVPEMLKRPQYQRSDVRNGTTCLPYPPAITLCSEPCSKVSHEGVFEAVIRILHFISAPWNNRVPNIRNHTAVPSMTVVLPMSTSWDLTFSSGSSLYLLYIVY
jgi:hypothetical protein